MYILFGYMDPLGNPKIVGFIYRTLIKAQGPQGFLVYG